jgi:hypothetical protein
MDKFYTDILLPNINSRSQFFLSLHFYESILFSLIKRREPVRRNQNLIKEITEKESAVINEMLSEVACNSHNVENKIEIDEFDKKENDEVEDKTISISPDQMDNEIKETMVFSSNKYIGKKPKNKSNKNPDMNNNSVNKNKNGGRNLRARKWRETCYICDEFGNLICCYTCTNVVHQFCACLDVSYLFNFR